MEFTKDNILPVGVRYLVEAYKQASKTTAGFEVVQGDGFATSVCGYVIRAGDSSCKWKEGDLLFWRRYSLDTLRVTAEDGEHEYSLIDESEIIAQIKDAASPPVEVVAVPPVRTGNYTQITERKNAQQETASLQEDRNQIIGEGGDEDNAQASSEESKEVLNTNSPTMDENNTAAPAEEVAPEVESAPAETAEVTPPEETVTPAEDAA